MSKGNIGFLENIRIAAPRVQEKQFGKQITRLNGLSTTLKRNWQRICRKTQSFFAYVRGRSNASKKLGPLTDSQGEVVESSEGMSEVFNEAFGKVFTKESQGDIPEAKWEYSNIEGSELCDIMIDEDTVMKKLEKLRDDKATEAGEMVPS